MVCGWWKKPAEKKIKAKYYTGSTHFTIAKKEELIKSVKTIEELVFSFRNSIKKEVL